jgi:hypothetical protein
LVGAVSLCAIASVFSRGRAVDGASTASPPDRLLDVVLSIDLLGMKLVVRLAEQSQIFWVVAAAAAERLAVVDL